MYPWAVWGAGAAAVPGCASEMDQRTPAFSGYIHKAPVDNQTSGENSNILTRCLIARKTQTKPHAASRPRLVLPLTNALDFFSVSSHKLYLNSVTVKVAGKGGWEQIQVILCSPVTPHPCSETCWTITLGSFWLKAWEWSADCINYRPEITADQGLSDNIYTRHFILLSFTAQWFSCIHTWTHVNT